MSDQKPTLPAPTAPTKLGELLNDLDAGIFEAKAAAALSLVAQGVVFTGKKGKVSIEFNLERIGDTNQVKLVHAVKFTKPTNKGKETAEDTTTTPIHVSNSGRMSLFPETQPSLPGMGVDPHSRENARTS